MTHTAHSSYLAVIIEKTSCIRHYSYYNRILLLVSGRAASTSTLLSWSATEFHNHTAIAESLSHLSHRWLPLVKAAMTRIKLKTESKLFIFFRTLRKNLLLLTFSTTPLFKRYRIDLQSKLKNVAGNDNEQVNTVQESWKGLCFRLITLDTKFSEKPQYIWLHVNGWKMFYGAIFCPTFPDKLPGSWISDDKHRLFTRYEQNLAILFQPNERPFQILQSLVTSVTFHTFKLNQKTFLWIIRLCLFHRADPCLLRMRL